MRITNQLGDESKSEARAGHLGVAEKNMKTMICIFALAECSTILTAELGRKTRIKK